MNLAQTTMSSAEQEHALAGRLAVRKIHLKNNRSPLPAALHLAIHHFLSQNHWPVISAEALIEARTTENYRTRKLVNPKPVFPGFHCRCIRNCATFGMAKGSAITADRNGPADDPCD